MRRRRRRHEPEISRERWLVSYADFITLLFAFFTVLYASSTVDARKLASMVASMQHVFTGGSQGSPAPNLSDMPGADAPGDLAVVHTALAADLAADIAAGRVSVESDPRGVVVSIREAGSFDTASDALPPAAQAIVSRVALRLRAIPNAARIEGHTDDVPIRTARFGSNWELSTARATRVVAYLVEQAGIGPERLSAAGYSQFHPAVANDSASGRARNRRVDIVILNAATRNAEEPAR